VEQWVELINEIMNVNSLLDGVKI